MIRKFNEFNESLFQKDTTGQNYDEKGENLIVQQDNDLPYYDRMRNLLDRANVLYCKYMGDDPEDWTITTAEIAKDCLLELDQDHELYDEAQNLYDEIENLEDERDEADEEERLDKEDYFNVDDEDDEDEEDGEDDDTKPIKESVDEDKEVSSKDQQKLFHLLDSLGFSRQKTQFNKIIFRNDDEALLFPQKLKVSHFLSTRKQLVENGWIYEKDFNEKFSDVIGDDEEDSDVVKETMEDLLSQADVIYSKYSGQETGKYGFDDPEEAMEYLSEIERGDKLYKEAQNLIIKIDAMEFETDDDDDDDEEELIDLLKKAGALYSKYSNFSNKNHVDGEYIFTDPDEAMEYLLEIDEESKYYDEAQDLIEEIDEFVEEDDDDDDDDDDNDDDEKDEDDYSKYEVDLDRNYKEYIKRAHGDKWEEKYKDYLRNKYRFKKEEEEKSKNVGKSKKAEKSEKPETYYNATIYLKSNPSKEAEVLIKCGETDDNEDIFYYVEDEGDIKELMSKTNDENFVIKKYEKTELKPKYTYYSSYRDYEDYENYHFM